jgi:uncharacterized membrane protein HdeD (DUF308 family)
MPYTLADAGFLLRNWWALVIRGALAVVFAIITFVDPRISIAALVLVFGAYAFVDGVTTLISGFRRRGALANAVEPPRWLLILEGLAGIAAGVVTLFWPAITAVALVYIVAAWSLVSGGLKIAAAIQLRKVVKGEWLLALAGVATIALGVMLFMMPAIGLLALVFWIGAYALVFGITLITLGFRLRSWQKSHASEIEMRHGPYGTAGAH